MATGEANILSATWLLVLPLALVAYTHGVALLGWAFQRADDGTRPTALQPRELSLVVREACARALFWVLTPLGWIPTRPRERRRADDARHAVPLLVVPGMGWNRGVLLFLATFLRHRGWSWVWPVGWSRPRGSLADEAAHLATCLRTLRETSGADRVDVVAFSTGGLAVAWALKHDPTARSAVRRLVTLATPWEGTKLAAFGRSTAMREIRYGSPVLDGLWPDATEVVCVWSRDDVLVVPAHSAAPAGPATDVCIEAAGHLELLTSARAFRAVQAALERA